jgi:hypothetical protein
MLASIEDARRGNVNALIRALDFPHWLEAVARPQQHAPVSERHGNHRRIKPDTDF